MKQRKSVSSQLANYFPSWNLRGLGFINSLTTSSVTVFLLSWCSETSAWRTVISSFFNSPLSILPLSYSCMGGGYNPSKVSLVPRPHPFIKKRVWWLLSAFLFMLSQQDWFLNMISSWHCIISLFRADTADLVQPGKCSVVPRHFITPKNISLVPRPSLLPVCDCTQYGNNERPERLHQWNTNYTCFKTSAGNKMLSDKIEECNCIHWELNCGLLIWVATSYSTTELIILPALFVPISHHLP